ncbi:DUF4190 domain-containing protein [Alkalicoccus halolimnae]|uniref:DUF4190 domain-containing protein n=1 Tax=Alkalicoccus halolimnae TaxID=1667239 RepID=A0A5C7FQ25_9BACI|nr:DUF4190 domain-containing protein [Alkalicoccus halolimnae]TXF86845.1 DUF4352 domain-containing protein [Alkalicoccus halolimnae]
MSEEAVSVSQSNINANGLATASLVLGIVGLVIGLIPFLGWFLFPAWILAIIFGIIGRKQNYKRGSATVGMVLGIVTLVYKFGFWIVIALIPTEDAEEFTATASENNQSNEIAAMDNENEDSVSNNSEDNANEVNNEAEADQEEAVSVGDTINFDGLEITLNKAYTSSGNDFEEPGNDHFAILDLTIVNKTDEPANVSTILQMSLQDGDGYTHDATIYTESQGSLDGEIGEGRENRGEVVFDVNESDTYEFIFEHPFTSGQAIWKVELED